MGQIKGRTCWRFTIIESNVLVCVFTARQTTQTQRLKKPWQMPSSICNGNRNVSARWARGLLCFSELCWRNMLTHTVLIDSQTHTLTYSLAHTLTHTLVLFYPISQAAKKSCFALHCGVLRECALDVCSCPCVCSEQPGPFCPNTYSPQKTPTA